jgi:DNA-directed RNA polymerase subunit beta
LDALKNKYSKQLADLREEMIKKLTHLLNGKTSSGVKHKFGDELITKGVKISSKVIENNLFPDKETSIATKAITMSPKSKSYCGHKP